MLRPAPLVGSFANVSTFPPKLAFVDVLLGRRQQRTGHLATITFASNSLIVWHRHYPTRFRNTSPSVQDDMNIGRNDVATHGLRGSRNDVKTTKTAFVRAARDRYHLRLVTGEGGGA